MLIGDCPSLISDIIESQHSILDECFQVVVGARIRVDVSAAPSSAQSTNDSSLLIALKLLIGSGRLFVVLIVADQNKRASTFSEMLVPKKAAFVPPKKLTPTKLNAPN